ncbi:MAG TPA: hypothetical protein DCR93_05490, partial [Cytophagales bacterium]|nr:hypothetical protein [Cytophagales bacterium]
YNEPWIPEAIAALASVAQNSTDCSGARTLAEPQKALFGVAELAVHPNPNAGAFSLSLQGGELSEEATLVITNTVGQVVYEGTLEAGSPTANIQLVQPDAGFYFLVLTSGNQRLTKRILIQ